MSIKKVSRRKFLKNAAATAAGAFAMPYIVTSTALGNSTTPPASERITVGHIGVGGQGGGLSRTFAHLKDAQSIAVCDTFGSRRDSRANYINEAYATQNDMASYKGCAKYGDFRELLARDDLDAIVVATPDHWHVPIGLAAARAGKDMYIEKPLGVSMEENKTLAKAIALYGNIFQYGTQQRSSDHCRFGCELIRNGRIGKIHTIHVTAPGSQQGGSITPVAPPEDLDYDMWLGPAPQSPYTKDRCTNFGAWFVYDNSLGFIAGWGAHPLDILDWAYGDENLIPVEYEGTGTIPAEGLYSTITQWDLRCKYANGVTMTFKVGGDSTKFVGTDGWIEIRRRDLTASDPKILAEATKPSEIHLTRSKSQQQNFLDSIKTRSNAISPIVSAVRSDAISHLGNIAIRTGRKIKWDNAAETIIGDAEASRMLKRSMRSPWHL